MRPISDEEWFASLAEADKPLPNSPPKEQPASKAPTPPPKEMPRRASTAAVALSPPNLTSNPSYKNVPSPVITPVGPSSRSGSVNSRGSRLSRHSSTEASPPHSADVTNQDRLRKQDRLLAHLKRHRRDDRDASGTSSPHLCGDRDLDADHYVNYEVAFSYRRSADMRKHGSGLHMIAHFGWGVRGVGGSEFPVYLDVVELHGRMRVRVLLSAGPPFASEVSFSFVNMPYFDISARPLRAGSFNAMDIPLLKSYIEKSIAKVAAGFIAPKSYTLDVDRLLLGHESVLQTETMGVFRIVIHSASNLPHTDAIGSCDPYVAVSYSKFHKPRELSS
jgi:hypothetical protein